MTLNENLPFLIIITSFIYLALYLLKKKSLKITHGTASWLSKRELKKLMNKKNDGIVIDGINRLTKQASKENLIIVAPTGQGKSTGFVIPNIILSQDYSTVVVDPSGEIFEATSSAMQRMGFNIKVWSPIRNESNGFNPIHNVRSIKDAGMVGASLMSRFESKGSPIWHKAGASLLQAIFYYLHLQSIQENTNYRTMDNVLSFLSYPFEKQDKLVKAINDEDLNFIYSSFRDANKEAKGGIQLMAKEGVAIFLEEKVKNITSFHTIDFAELRNQKTILYLIFPELEIEYYSPLLQIFFGQLFHFANTNTTGYDIFAIIEEAGNMGKIPNLPKATTTLRKFGVSISLVLQELSQLDSIYGREDAEVIKSGGCVTKLFLPGLGHKACKEISEILGTKTIRSESNNKSLNNRSSESVGNTKSNMSRHLMNPDEIRKMKDWTLLMIRKNQKPALLKVTPVFKQKKFKYFLEYSKNNKTMIDNSVQEQAYKLDIDKIFRQLEGAEENEIDLNPTSHSSTPEEDILKVPKMEFLE